MHGAEEGLCPSCSPPGSPSPHVAVLQVWVLRGDLQISALVFGRCLHVCTADLQALGSAVFIYFISM